MLSIYENNEKISGACRSFVLCLDYVAISPFIYFKQRCSLCQHLVYPVVLDITVYSFSKALAQGTKRCNSVVCELEEQLHVPQRCKPVVSKRNNGIKHPV